MPNVPQLSVPLRLVGSSFATTEQDSPQELAERVNVLVRTPPGWLDGRAGFGLADQEFRRGGADLAAVAGQIDTWIPDVAAAVDENPGLLDDALDYLGIQVAGR